jgi:hypothetical protein
MGFSPSPSLNDGDHWKKTHDGGWSPSSFGGGGSSRWWCSGVGKGFYGGGGPRRTSWGGGSRMMWRWWGKEARVSPLAAKIRSKTGAISRAFCSKISHVSRTLSPSCLIRSGVWFCCDSSVGGSHLVQHRARQLSCIGLWATQGGLGQCWANSWVAWNKRKLGRLIFWPRSIVKLSNISKPL